MHTFGSLMTFGVLKAAKVEGNLAPAWLGFAPRSVDTPPNRNTFVAIFIKFT
jgi:hypothetical protein